MRRHIGNALRILTIVVLCWFVVRGQPPAAAQITAYDGRQDDRIADLKATEASTDLKLQRINDAIAANSNAIAQMQGEERALAGLLLLLQIGSFVLQSKKNGGTT